ncbi:MAG TPA: ATP-binding protein [Candidatus Krumholzibacteria bacterium]|nr:ATP-binding protein [Candidatus Krumholzibacteria bacterium]
MTPLAHHLDLLVLDRTAAAAVLALPGAVDWTVREWESLEAFVDFVESTECDQSFRLAVAAHDASVLDVQRLRALQLSPRRIDVFLAITAIEPQRHRELLQQGIGRVESLPLAPHRLEVMFHDRCHLAALFPGEVRGLRRETVEFEVPATTSAIPGVVRSVCERADAMGHPNDFVRSQLPLVVDEALTNAMKHGNGWDASTAVEFRAALTPTAIELEVRDRGRGFDRSDVRDPLHADNRSREGGRGLFLMESIMDSVQYHDGGRTIVLQKDLVPSAPLRVD